MQEVPILNVKGFDNTGKSPVQKSSSHAEDSDAGENGFLALVAQMAEERGIPLNAPFTDEMIGEILSDFKSSGQGDALSGEKLLELLWQLKQGSLAHSDDLGGKISQETRTAEPGPFLSGESTGTELLIGQAGEKTGAELIENSVPKIAVDTVEQPSPNIPMPEPAAQDAPSGHTRGIQPSESRVLDQIVGKASLNVNEGQSEIKIDLKPPELGRILMNISTSDNQVTVKMLTEIPLVKDIIDNNLNQLKVELGAFGLEIDRFDVSVARDFDKNGEPSFAEFSETPGESINNMKEQALPVNLAVTKETGEGIDGGRIDYFA